MLPPRLRFRLALRRCTIRPAPVRSIMSLKRKAGDQPASDGAKKTKQNAITAFFAPPKSSPSGSKAANGSASPAAPASKFDKAAWVATLTDEQRDLLALEINTLHESWLVHLKDELVSREFLQLKRFLKAEVERGATVFPPSADVYAWSRLTPLHTVKVVILGQDPYHGVNQAHGLCFSVRPPTPAPPSLKNMYRALERDYPAFKPPPRNGGLLTPWARRGVLLLNSALTVRAHEANSHAGKGWERFTRRVVELVDRSRRSGVVFLAWGAHAQERCAKVGARHLVLKSVHPSPLSAHRGFLDCGHFKKANEWLKTRYGEDGQIDWSLDAEEESK